MSLREFKVGDELGLKTAVVKGRKAVLQLLQQETIRLLNSIFGQNVCSMNSN